jgi:hypothetical protein
MGISRSRLALLPERVDVEQITANNGESNDTANSEA